MWGERFGVKKFGGTSLGSVTQIERVCRYLRTCYDSGERFVVVASAMGGETNRLLGLARELDADPHPAFYDRVFATGELAAVGLLAIGLNRFSLKARPFSGSELPVWTIGGHQKARVDRLATQPLFEALEIGEIPIIAGCQGIDVQTEKITTLGRGGSDTSAVAAAVALGSVPCELFSDVDGVYSADPRVCKTAKILPHIDYLTMMELASLGAKVMQIRSVDLAYRYKVPVHVRSAFSWKEGTWIMSESQEPFERLCVSHITFDENQAKIRIHGLPRNHNVLSLVLNPLAEHKIGVDMIVQSVAKSTMDVYFTVKMDDYDKSMRITQEIADRLGAEQVVGDDQVAKVSVVGSGMMDHFGVASTFFGVLAKHRIPVYLTATSEIKISVLVPRSLATKAIEVVHKTFIDEVWHPAPSQRESPEKSKVIRANMA